MEILLNSIAGLTAGILVLIVLRKCLGLAAFAAPAVAAIVCFFLFHAHYKATAAAIVEAGHYPCSVFHAGFQIFMIGGAILDFTAMLTIVGVVALLRYLRKRTT